MKKALLLPLIFLGACTNHLSEIAMRKTIDSLQTIVKTFQSDRAKSMSTCSIDSVSADSLANYLIVNSTGANRNLLITTIVKRDLIEMMDSFNLNDTLKISAAFQHDSSGMFISRFAMICACHPPGPPGPPALFSDEIVFVPNFNLLNNFGNPENIH